MLGLRMWLEHYICLWHLVGMMLWSWLRGTRVDCISSGYVVVWYAYVGVWHFFDVGGV